MKPIVECIGVSKINIYWFPIYNSSWILIFCAGRQWQNHQITEITDKAIIFRFLCYYYHYYSLDVIVIKMFSSNFQKVTSYRLFPWEMIVYYSYAISLFEIFRPLAVRLILLNLFTELLHNSENNMTSLIQSPFLLISTQLLKTCILVSQ